MPDPKVLETEIAYYNERKPDLVEHYLGQFVLIRERELAGSFTTFDEAYAEGVKRYGNVPMLIRRVQKDEPVDHIPALSLGLTRVHPQ